MDDMGSPCSLTELELGVGGQGEFTDHADGKRSMDGDGGGDGEDGEEMNTASLAEVLATKGKFLEELELWALCRECCLTLEYVHDCHDLFQSLCISPDTVAFDPEGNVCFLDLDMEPEAVYVSPEKSQYGEHSFKSHLFSLGMTLLFATEYNTGSDDPRSEISDTFTDLLTSLTHDDSELRPELDAVIEACEKTLGEDSSQDICLRIVGLQPNHGQPESQEKPNSSSSIQQMTDDLSAYLQSQSGLVETKPVVSEINESDSKEKDEISKKDVNDNSPAVKSKEVSRQNPSKGKKSKPKVKDILRDVSFDEDDSMLSDLEETKQSRRARKQKGIMLNDVLSSLERNLDETELWSLCREAVLTLQRKKKHLPAYISPDTVMVRECGTISFKAIPEEKPLEVIYMAPELQAKGMLNEKTCVYGLGITLRSAAGGKYTSSLALPDAEALEILLSSFLQLNQHKRPTLDTALEMCEEYQKVNEAASRDVCQKMYHEALEAATTKSENSSQEPPSKNSWDESDMDFTTQASTDNTRSLAQAGDTTEAEDNIDDIPFDDDQDDTNPEAVPVFKAISFGSETNTAQLQATSAFKPVPVKAKPAKKLERVPSAFSSPATHFKPIVIQDKGNHSESIGGSQSKSAGAKETDVVGKLREIKDNLQRHRNNEAVFKESKNTTGTMEMMNSSSSQLQQSQTKQKNQTNEGASNQTAFQLQAQGNLPNTDALASAIAHYLKNHLSGGLPPLSNDLPLKSVHDTQEPVNNHAVRQSHQHFIAPSNMTSFASSIPSSSTTVPSSATSLTMSTYSSSSSSPMYNVNPYHVSSSYSPGNIGPLNSAPGTTLLPPSTALPANNMTPIIGPYPAAFPSLGQMPVQFTLMQDPVTGLMQMVPCMLPVSSQASPSFSQTMPTPSPQQVPASTERSGSSHIYKSYQQNNTSTPHSNTSESHSQKQHQPKELNPNIAHSNANFGRASHTDYYTPTRSQEHKPTSAHPTALKAEDRSRTVAHEQSDTGTSARPDAGGAGHDGDSQSSSPSPSKDSGICVTQQPPALAYSKDPLMERLLSSQDSHRQRTLSQVLRVIREEFADDGVFDSGVEDLAIAEYILSLSSLTWETFRCAITEKFFHLVWTYDLLAILYETIGGSPSPQFRNFSRTPPSGHNKPLSHESRDRAEDRHLAQPDTRIPDSKSQKLQQQHYQTVPSGISFSGSLGGHREKGKFGGSSADDTAGREHEQVSAGSGTHNRLAPRGLGNSTYQQRPRSEVGGLKSLWSETSDSTDSEARDKRRRFKKRGELDKSKSSSLHNIHVGINTTGSTTNYGHIEASPAVLSNLTTGAERRSLADSNVLRNDIHKTSYTNTYSINTTETPSSPVAETAGTLTNFSTDGFDTPNHNVNTRFHIGPSSATHTPVLRANDFTSQPTKHPEARSTNISALSHSSSRSGSSQEQTQGYKTQQSPRNAQGGFSPRMTNILPSKPTYPRGSHYPSSHILPSRDYAGSSSSNSPNDQPLRRPQTQSISHEPALAPGIPRGQNGMTPAYTSNDDDSEVDKSAEMRRLAAQKPELFQDTRPNKGTFSSDKTPSRQVPANTTSAFTNAGLSNGARAPNHSQSEQRPSHGSIGGSQAVNVINNRLSVPDHIPPSDRFNSTSLAPTMKHSFTSSMSALPSYEPSTSASKTRSDQMSLNTGNMNYSNNHTGSNTSSNFNSNISNCNNNPPPYGRSLSAVYTRRHPAPETGVTVSAGNSSSPFGASEGDLHQAKGHHRRGSDGSVHLPELNSALLPYSNKGQIVYHSAMIQLSLTPEVDEFIHSIDEENKRAIEMRLASVQQEITVQHRQRRKTQRFYRKLHEQGTEGKTSKNDQAVSEQMLKDMTEMTRKISFLQLCQTHLQMLLAELYGLDTCFLYSLAAAEPGQQLTLQPVQANLYLQFRTVSTVEAGQMSVLQAGTPRGLMSYLYTSSALSDGYIHQFLICFRYILTADQLLNFILEKFRSAQNHYGDVNMLRVLRRSLDLLHVWLEGYYSIDFSNNKRLLRKLADFLTEQNEANVESAEELFSLYAACRMGDHSELMLATEMDEDEDEGATYFLHLTNPKRPRYDQLMEWESFRSLLRRSKSEKGSSGKSRSDFQGKPLGGLQQRPGLDFSLSECPAHTLAEQLTLLEQETFRKCHPIHFLNSQCQGVGVALSIPGLRTPSMSRKLDTVQASKKGLFVGEPLIESYVVHMIAHSQEVSHWVAAEVLSCGSNKSQTNMITKFLTVGHLCLEVKNYATGVAILEGLENLVVRQLSVWKNVSSKYMSYLDQMTAAKMKLKGEALALMSQKDCHVYPTIPSALFLALHLQQAEIGGFTLANGMFKWDKMRSISEIVDQARIFRDHEYGFRPEQDIQRALKRRLEDFSDQDLHTVASSQDNNFRRHSSSSSLSGTLKKVKDKLGSKKK